MNAFMFLLMTCIDKACVCLYTMNKLKTYLRKIYFRLCMYFFLTMSLTINSWLCLMSRKTSNYLLTVQYTDA